MKKSKIALAVAAAAVMATSTVGLAACSKGTTPGTQPKGVYKITFDANGGKFSNEALTESKYTVNGVLAEFPSNPSKTDDSTFVGWTLTFGSDETFDLTHVFTEPKTVYAVWGNGNGGGGGNGGESDTTYTLQLNPAGGTIAAGDPHEVTTGTDHKLASVPAAPTKGSDTFNGWYTAATGGTKITTDYVFDANGTIYAQWTPAGQIPTGVFTIELDAETNGGTIAAGDPHSVQTSGGKLTSIPALPSKLGSTCNGWFTAATGGEKVTTDTVFNEGGKIFAQFTPNVVDLSRAVASVGGVNVQMNISDLTAGETNGYMDKELSLVDAQISAANTVISFKYNNQDIEFEWYEGDSPATSATLTGKTTTQITNKVAGKYSVYLKHYTSQNEGGEHWYVVAKINVRDDTATLDTTATAADWYLTGDMLYSFGDCCTQYKLTAAQSGVYEITKELPAYASVKIKNGVQGNGATWVGGEDNWVLSGVTDGVDVKKGDNLSILKTATYKFSYNTTSGKITVSKAGGGSGEVVNEDAVMYKGGVASGTTFTAKPKDPATGLNVEYYATDVSLDANDVISFKVGDKAIKLFGKEEDSNKLKVKGSALDEVTVSEQGVYTVSIAHYNEDAHYVIWVGKAPTTPTDGRVLCNDDDIYLVGQFDGDEGYYWDWGWALTEGVGGDAPDTYVEWTITKELKVGEKIKIRAGKTVGYGFEEIEAGDGSAKACFAKDGDDIKVVTAGTYKFFVKPSFSEGTKIWVQSIGGQGQEQPMSGTYKVGASGAAQDLEEKTSTEQDVVHQFAIEGVQFTQGDKLYFTIDGTAITLKVEATSTGVETPSTSGAAINCLTVTDTGKFNIYIKKYADEYWMVYAKKLYEGTITNIGSAVTVGNAYLVGDLAGTDVEFENWKAKGVQMTGSGDVYTLTVTLSENDVFKFIKRTGGDADTQTTWVSTWQSLGVSDYFGLAGTDIKCLKTGEYQFSVNFASGKITLVSTPDGTFVEDTSTVPSNGIRLTFTNNVTVTIIFTKPDWAPTDGALNLHMWGTGISGFPMAMNGDTKTLGFATTAIDGWQIQFWGDDNQMKYSVNLSNELLTDGAVLNYELDHFDGSTFLVK